MEEDKLGALFKKTLEEHTEEYPEGAWEGFLIRQRRKRAAIRRYIATGAAAMLALALLTGVFLRQQKDKVQITPLQKITELPNIKKELNSGQIPSGREAIEQMARAERVLQKNRESKEDMPARLADLVAGNKEDKGEDMPSAEQSLREIPKEPEGRHGDHVQQVTAPGKTHSQRDAITDLRDLKRSGRRILKYGINLAPGLSSANGMQAFNLSGGINLDIAIAKNLSISTGVQIEHTDLGENKNFDAAGFDVSAIQYRTSVTNLDIPVNITWQISSDRKSSYYISGGISSLAYLDEKQSATSYKNEPKESFKDVASGIVGDPVYRLETVKTTVTNKLNQADNFDFAGRLNLSFGYSYMLSPKLRLHFEPYVKIPLSNLGNTEMRYTTSGVLCKISF
jgi:hypothetical protein